MKSTTQPSAIIARRHTQVIDGIEPHISCQVEPARRHKCETCQQVFICHLCVISHDHPLHSLRLQASAHVFVCWDCAKAKGMNTVRCVDSWSHTTKIYNYETGEVVSIRHWLPSPWLHSGRKRKAG